jgi:hypothetical protein
VNNHGIGNASFNGQRLKIIVVAASELGGGKSAIVSQSKTFQH